MKINLKNTLVVTILCFGIASFIVLGNITHLNNEDIALISSDSTYTEQVDYRQVERISEYKPDVALLNQLIQGVKKLYEIAVNL